MFIIALISVPCTTGGFEYIHITFGVRTIKIDQRHMSFRLSVGCLNEIRTFLKCNCNRFARCITIFGCCTAEIAILQNLVSSSSELCLNKLLVKVAECLIRTIYIIKHFIRFFLVCTIGMKCNDCCCHWCKHSVVIIALNFWFQAEFFELIQSGRKLIKCICDFCKSDIFGCGFSVFGNGVSHCFQFISRDLCCIDLKLNVFINGIMLFRVILFAVRNILDRFIRQFINWLLDACKKMFIIAFISVPCSVIWLTNIHVTLSICTCKIDEWHMSFRHSVFRF